jgi:hypothetical protein
MPDMSRFFSTADHVSLSKNVEVLKEAESYLRTTRAKFTPILEEYTTSTVARKLLRLNEVQVARLICGKPNLPEFPYGSNASQKWPDRIAALHNHWIKYISTVVTESNLFEKYGSSEGQPAEDCILTFQSQPNSKSIRTRCAKFVFGCVGSTIM